MSTAQVGSQKVLRKCWLSFYDAVLQENGDLQKWEYIHQEIFPVRQNWDIQVASLDRVSKKI